MPVLCIRKTRGDQQQHHSSRALYLLTPNTPRCSPHRRHRVSTGGPPQVPPIPAISGYRPAISGATGRHTWRRPRGARRWARRRPRTVRRWSWPWNQPLSGRSRAGESPPSFARRACRPPSAARTAAVGPWGSNRAWCRKRAVPSRRGAWPRNGPPSTLPPWCRARLGLCLCRQLGLSRPPDLPPVLGLASPFEPFARFGGACPRG
mmetsp:Transcript_9846/g.18096  ORF Transcript_9846/g.18096 Transcript_9846/m.18096 type:complete len:206 (-) Transcript_9846:197-814(-)